MHETKNKEDPKKKDTMEEVSTFFLYYILVLIKDIKVHDSNKEDADLMEKVNLISRNISRFQLKI